MSNDLDIRELYRAYAPSIYRRAQMLLRNDAEAHDAVQDIFERLLHKAQQFEGRSALMTWVYSVTTNHCLNRIRDGKRRRELLEAHQQDEAPPSSADPATQLLVRDILGRVPEELARVAVYYYFDELTHDEIAELLGVSRRNVGYQLERFHERAARLIERGA